LRERSGDIRELADFFFESLSKKLGRQISGMHSDVYDLLKLYSFPGNVRELKNIIERAIIICDSDMIMPHHFRSLNSNQPRVYSEPGAEIFDLLEIEKQTILRALHKVNFNKAEAARLLNIEWNALYRRIQKFKIELP
jgi:transcriptional regulator with PAS, ATPase and Fis domain